MNNPSEPSNREKWPEWVAACKNLAKTWQTLSTEIQTWAKNPSPIGEPDPFAVISLLEKTRDSGREVQGVLSMADTVATWAATARDKQLAEFDQQIRDFCAKRGIGISGRFPTYVVDLFHRVHLDTNKGESTVSTQKLQTASPVKILEALNIALDEERHRIGDPALILDSVEQAYSKLIAVRQRSLGDPISVRDVFREQVLIRQTERFWKSPTRSNFTDYSEEHFARDLSRLIATSTLTSGRGLRLELLPTAFPRDGIRIYQEDGERIVGSVAFRKTSS